MKYLIKLCSLCMGYSYAHIGVTPIIVDLLADSQKETAVAVKLILNTIPMWKLLPIS